MFNFPTAHRNILGQVRVGRGPGGGGLLPSRGGSGSGGRGQVGVPCHALGVREEWRVEVETRVFGC